MVSLLAKAAAAVAVALTLAASAAAVDDSVYVGSPADACPTVGRVLRECRCSLAVTPPRSVVLPTTEASGEWCPVVDGPAITRYYCDTEGVSDCRVVCRVPRDYCVPGSLRRDGTNCRCAKSGNRVVVLPK